MAGSHNNTPNGTTAAVPQASSNSYTTASLYIGNLANEVTEVLLFDIFKSVGPVSSIKVCRDAITRRSLGYAYVNFHSTEDAERALDTLNFTQVSGRPCRIMWCQRDPSKRKTGLGNIFIKNLEKSIDSSNLFDTFSAFGNILSCKVELDSNGSSKGFGYVHFETQEEADLAIARVNGMIISGQQVYVGPFLSRKERVTPAKEEIEAFTNIFVKNLSEDITQERFVAEFQKYGKILSAALSEENGKSKGFGFVNFENPEDAQKAVDGLNNQLLGQKVIYVGRALKRTERLENLQQKYQGVNLYLKNIADTVDDDQLRREFERFGVVTSAKVMRDEKGNSKGFGFVCFSSSNEATKAVTEMNGNLFSGKPLYVGLAQRKDIRKAQLEAQHTHRSNGVPGVPIRVPGVPMLPPHPIYPTPGPMYYPGAPMMQGPPQRTHVYPPGMQRQPRVHSNPQAHNGQYPYGMPNYGAQGQRPQTQLPRNPNPRKFATQANGTLVPQPNGNSMIPPSATQQPNGKPRNIGGNPQQRGFKYTPTARNAVQMAPPQSVAAPVQAPVTTLPSLEQLELTMGPEEAKQVIGEQIYFSISRIHPQYAALSGKITGMLLELELRDLYGLLQNRSLLESKVNEAIQVLEANSKDGASSPLISEGQSVS
eukprot:TRINITY_DN895_c0_g3_i1.p1 TRINITY_DN895_c0_g3~~TRINITY_DN895_c0_g3_i1.p1  ORF type:complete len:652 (-),score=129.41 TRINITY_DN895_c0_g3_i1:105-2060(-)